MKQCSKVSIIVPIYNAEKYLDACLESIISQDYNYIEVLLINDGSTDRSEAICKKYVSKDHRVVYLYQDNSGVSAARNHGLDVCTGKYVSFLDSDDKLKPTAIGCLVHALEEANADLCICGYEIMTKDRNIPCPIEKEIVTESEEIAGYFSAHYLEAITSSVWGKLYRKELITQRFERSITMGEDMLFNLEYIRQIQSVCAINETLYLYNKQNASSLTNNYKLSYYGQDLHVTRRWLSWIRQFDEVDEINLHYRISNAFFYSLQIICSELKKEERIERLKSMVSSELIEAVEKAIHRYNIVQKAMFGLLLQRKYRMLIVAGTVYSQIKQLYLRNK